MRRRVGLPVYFSALVLAALLVLASLTRTPATSAALPTDTDGDGYSNAQELVLGRNPDDYCAIMRANVDDSPDNTVSAIDLALVASKFLQFAPPAPERYNQGAPNVRNTTIDTLDLAAIGSVFLKNVSECTAANFTLTITSTTAATEISPIIHPPQNPFDLNNAGCGSSGGPTTGVFHGSAPAQVFQLVPNVAQSYGFNQMSCYYVQGGTAPYPGASVNIVQTVTVNGVSVNVPRTITLVTAGGGSHNCANIFSSPEVTVSVDLGSWGIVDVTVPLMGQAAEDCNNGVTIQRGIVIVPGTTRPLVLHDVPP